RTLQLLRQRRAARRHSRPAGAWQEAGLSDEQEEPDVNLLITGAARGLGYELTAEALRRGHRVFAGARSPKDSPKLIALQEAHPELLSVHTLNVADEAQIERLAAELAGQGVRLDCVINNAGILK